MPDLGVILSLIENPAGTALLAVMMALQAIMY